MFGKLKALGVTSAVRTPLLPNVPTLAESGIDGYEISGWVGICGPAGLPVAVVDRISADMLAFLHEDATKALAERGVDTHADGAEGVWKRHCSAGEKVSRDRTPGESKA